MTFCTHVRKSITGSEDLLRVHKPLTLSSTPVLKRDLLMALKGPRISHEIWRRPQPGSLRTRSASFCSPWV
jgi:hypothetical protein